MERTVRVAAIVVTVLAVVVISAVQGVGTNRAVRTFRDNIQQFESLELKIDVANSAVDFPDSITVDDPHHIVEIAEAILRTDTSHTSRDARVFDVVARLEFRSEAGSWTFSMYWDELDPIHSVALDRPRSWWRGQIHESLDQILQLRPDE